MILPCDVSVLLAILASLQLMCILFYCKMKLKHRYVSATLMSSVLLLLTLNLAFNCGRNIQANEPKNIFFNKDVEQHHRIARNIKPEMRELLVNNDLLSHHTVKFDRKLGENYYGKNTIENDFYSNGPKNEDVISVENAALVERVKQEFVQIMEGPTYQLTGVEKDVGNDAGEMENEDVVNDYDGEESATTKSTKEKRMKEYLASGIYNNMSETVLTFNEYQRIALQEKMMESRHHAIVSPLKKRLAIAAWKGVLIPLSPEDVLNKFSEYLLWWEQLEILSYDKIFYLGLTADEKINFVNNVTENFGFDFPLNEDDESGTYRAYTGDHIAYRYEIIKFLGSGSYGSVVSAFDHQTNKQVAIKFMANEKDWDDRYVTREMAMILKIENEAKSKKYFPEIYSHFMFRNHKCIVMELLGRSIHRRYRNMEPMNDMNLLKRFTRDILTALADLHDIEIIHGDIKPDNIMFRNGKSNKSSGELLKMADFGLACVQGTEEFKCPSYYVQTRYYRAPEVIMSLPFTVSADMWSVGVIVAELFLGKPPFWGESETDQLASMMEVLGLLPPHMVEHSTRQHIYQDAICYKTKSGFKRMPYRKPLSKVILQEAPKDFVQFVKGLLEYEPEKRLSAIAALNHPFLSR